MRPTRILSFEFDKNENGRFGYNNIRVPDFSAGIDGSFYRIVPRRPLPSLVSHFERLDGLREYSAFLARAVMLIVTCAPVRVACFDEAAKVLHRPEKSCAQSSRIRDNAFNWTRRLPTVERRSNILCFTPLCEGVPSGFLDVTECERMGTAK